MGDQDLNEVVRWRREVLPRLHRNLKMQAAVYQAQGVPEFLIVEAHGTFAAELFVSHVGTEAAAEELEKLARMVRIAGAKARNVLELPAGEWRKA